MQVEVVFTLLVLDRQTDGSVCRSGAPSKWMNTLVISGPTVKSSSSGPSENG